METIKTTMMTHISVQTKTNNYH